VHRWLRRMKRTEEGQSLVLASISMLILSIGVLATMNLGHAIHERIRLQNAADAAAYSTAAMQARAMNFYAFTNRAQVMQYTSMMSYQSYLSLMLFFDLAMARAGAVIMSIGRAMMCIVCCPPPGLRPAGQAICSVGKVVIGIEKAALRTITKLLDNTVGLYTNAMYAANWATYMEQATLSGAVYTHVGTQGLEIARLNDPDVSVTASKVLLAKPNIDAWNNASDDNAQAGSLPSQMDGSESEEVKRAERVMTEIANATRYPHFITDRDLLPPQLSGYGNWSMKQGQTKLITDTQNQENNIRHYIESTGQVNSQLALGYAMAAFDDVEFAPGMAIPPSVDIGPIGTFYVEVVANKDGGWHCGMDWDYKDSGYSTQNCGCGLPVSVKQDCFKPPDHDKHPWPGLAPYLKFAPKDDGSAGTDFGQPTTVALLNKDSDDLNRDPFTKDFRVTMGSGDDAEIDMSIGERGIGGIPGLGKGLNAMSRAMAYYHRPDNWQEQPNFFNPFWRAKLAPLAPWIDKKMPMGLGVVTDELFTH